jgi:uncharacterized protein (TIGR03086 family)
MSGNGTGEAPGDAGVLRMYGDAVAFFARGVHSVGKDQWDDPTPDEDWSVRDLVNHLTVEQLWVPPLVLDGARIPDHDERLAGDQLGEDPVGTWDRASAAALAAFGTPGALRRLVHLSYGDTRAAAYCAQMTTDAAVHGWDLARALGVDETIPPHLVAFALEESAPYADGLQATGLFAAPVPVPADADAQTRLLARLGRRA